MTAYLLLTYALLMTLGYVVGLTVGHWTVHAYRKRRTHRRQVLAQMDRALRWRYDVDCLDPSCVLCQRVHRG